MKYFIAILLLTTVTISCTKKETKPSGAASQVISEVKMVEKNALCSDHQFCQPLRASEEKCRKSTAKSDCKEFVELFAKLTARNDCKRKTDSGPVPSIWLCDEDPEESSYPKLSERAAKTLSVLKFSFAKEFYKSKEFRSILDGALAEDHM